MLMALGNAVRSSNRRSFHHVVATPSFFSNSIHRHNEHSHVSVGSKVPFLDRNTVNPKPFRWAECLLAYRENNPTKGSTMAFSVGGLKASWLDRRFDINSPTPVVIRNGLFVFLCRTRLMAQTSMTSRLPNLCPRPLRALMFVAASVPLRSLLPTDGDNGHFQPIQIMLMTFSYN